MKRLQRLAIFASGSGSNAEKIMEYFRDSKLAEVSVIFCNKPDAGVLQRAHKFGVPSEVFNRDDFYQNGRVMSLLSEYKIDYVILAGFLWLIPEDMVRAYQGRMINIHPALLPAFGGKGMYGSRVHKAVKETGAKESGITIHYVNEHYDEGGIIFQASFPINESDTVEDIEHQVHVLEHTHFPRVIEEVIKKDQL